MPLEPAPFGDDAPSGENLEYEKVFTDLTLAAQPGEERQMGKAVIEASEPDWKAVAAGAHAVLEQSHDLRAAVYLAMAEARMRGFPGYAEAVGYIAACLDRFWESCHPQLDADDDDDPTMRVNAVFGLADPDGALRSIRLAPLTRSRHFGLFSMRDIAIASGEVTAPPEMEDIPDETKIAAAFKDTDAEELKATLEGARASLEAVQEIDRIFMDKLPGQGPELGQLLRLLRAAVARLASEVGEPEEAAADDAEAAAEGAAPGGPAAVRGVPGAINSPRDVEAAIDRIIDYYLKNEPSSPVPIVLRRARRLVGADFMTILGDLAPGGVDNVQKGGWFEKEE